MVFINIFCKVTVIALRNHVLIFNKTSEVLRLIVLSLRRPETVLWSEVSSNWVPFAESTGSHFCVALCEKILADQSLYMACVAGDSLTCHLVGRAGYPVFRILAPVAKDLLVDFVLGSLATVNA